MTISKFKAGFMVFLACMAMAVSHAQTSSGTIVGTVADSTGAAIPGAKVTAVSNDTGEKRTVTTNGSGGYRIESVTPGTFTVTVEAASFSKAIFEKVHVVPSIPTSVNAGLKVGTQETVEVASDEAMLDTDTGSMSGLLTNTAVENLPIGSLSPYELALTLPGVVPSNAESFGNGVNFSVNGSRSRANNFLIEGSDNNDAGIHGQGFQPENLDAIDQVIVLTNSYQAEFGGGGGSVSNILFKNGSNQFHGAAWDRILNSTLDSNDKGNIISGQPKSKFRENIYGYDIGGYIIKDKLFFFNSLQWDHYRSSTESTLTVPTPTGVATLMSLLPNPRISTLLQAIGNNRGQDNPTSIYFQCIPISEATGATTVCPTSSVAVGPFIRSIPQDSNGLEVDAKGEYDPTVKDKVVLRYIRTHSSFPYDPNYPDQLPGFDTTQSGGADNAGITYTHIFTPNLLNDLRLSYGRIGFFFDFQAATYANPLGTAPTTSIPGLTGFGAPSGDPQSRAHNTYQIQDALSWNIGSRHAVKIGFDIENVRVRDGVPFNYYGSISYSSDLGDTGLANYIDDFGGTNNGGVEKDFGNPIARPQLYSQNYYIQDDWKVSKDLTIEAGFRYEYEGTPFNTVAYPAFQTTNPACTNPAVSGAGVPQFCVIPEKSDYADYGPRFGFAYAPEFFGKKTVFRGGFGIFYDGLFTNIIDNTQASAPNAASPSILSTGAAGGRGISSFSSYLTNGSLSPTPMLTNTIISMTPNIRSPETLQYNLDIEQDFGHGFVSSIGYVGTRGEHLYATTESNPFPNPDFFGSTRLFPNIGRVINRDNSGDSIYNSAQVQIERSYHHGFLMRASYTWSKFEDDVSEIFTTDNFSTYGMYQYPYPRKKIDYGQSALDTRHRLVISYVYTPPTWHPNGYLKVASSIVNGFTFSGIQQFTSGNPGNVEVGYDYNGDGISNDRPAISNPYAPQGTYAWDRAFWFDGTPGLCNGPELWYEGTCTPVTPSQVHYLVPSLAFNPDGSLQTFGAQPPIHRNNFRTLGTQEADVTVERNFHIHGSQNFLIRAECFNVLNQGTTGQPNLSLTSGVLPADGSLGISTFGNFQDTVSGSRTLRFYGKYSF